MKISQYGLPIAFIFVMILMLVGCENSNGRYQFRQDLSNIECVSICSYNAATDERNLISELDNDDGLELVESLSTLKCGMYGPGDHPRDYGIIIIAIAYTNKETELIGLHNIGWITPDGKRRLSNYYFEDKEVYDLVCRYISQDVLPDLS